MLYERPSEAAAEIIATLNQALALYATITDAMRLAEVQERITAARALLVEADDVSVQLLLDLTEKKRIIDQILLVQEMQKPEVRKYN